MHRSIELASGLLLCGFLVGGLVGCKKKNEYVEPPPPKVTVAQPITEPVTEYIELTGTTQAKEKVDLRSRVNGYLKEIKFKDGAKVSKGDLLFVIEPEPFEVELASAQAALARARATLELAKSQLARSEQLASTRSISQEEIDIQVAQRNTAAAEVATAEAAVRKAELDLGYTQIRAKINGRIGRHLVDVGNLVQAETTPLAIIEAFDPIYVYFSISESDFLRFLDLIRTQALPDPDKVPPVLHMGLASEAGYPHKGVLDYRDPSVDPETGTILRRGRFDNPKGYLVPGLFARIRAPIGQPAPKLLIDERAIGTDQRGDYVLVVNESNAVEYRPVKLGLSQGGRRVVEEGLQSDEWIVVKGLQRARPDTIVDPERIPPAQSEPSPAKDAPDEPPSKVN